MPDWLTLAACRGHDPEIFFPRQGRDATTAIAICRTCPVTDHCALEAAATDRVCGVWAGVMWSEGKPGTRRDRARKTTAPRRPQAAAAARRRDALAHLRSIQHEHASRRAAFAATAVAFGVTRGAVEAWERDARREARDTR